MHRPMLICLLGTTAAWLCCTAWTGCSEAAADELPRADGYRGIWYMNQPSRDEYRYKYSGGFATYPQQHAPIAIYAPAVERTFFVFGGTTDEENRDGRSLLHMVAWYDHATGTVPRPVILLDKETSDAHDNPVLSIDAQGHLWVFSNAHGTSRPAYIHRSTRPYEIGEFDRIDETNFSYCQPWHLGDAGFLVLHTRYDAGHRRLFLMTSPDGRQWSTPESLAYFGVGHYQVSWPRGASLGTAFNYHPPDGGLNARTNLYYLETADHGRTWQTAAGQSLTLPLSEVDNPALVHNFEAEGRLVYMKDLQYDAEGRPVILFVTSANYRAGPLGDPRFFQTARFDGRAWELSTLAPTDHNYDHGSLYIDDDGTWRVIAPTRATAEPYNTGGEIDVWVSRNQGRDWTLQRQLTRNSPRDHTYVRRPLRAHPDFAALWADGLARQPSASRLYFTNRAATGVWQLPAQMIGDTAKPQIVP
jgi:hypothetical protein